MEWSTDSVHHLFYENDTKITIPTYIAKKQKVGESVKDFIEIFRKIWRFAYVDAALDIINIESSIGTVKVSMWKYVITINLYIYIYVCVYYL